ncbi:MAG: UDP-glucose/GDP-mannose dehydrogenase family protein [Gammaproteobacteria bacterium]|nr:UDP-glucose/GDP-mannose dehydrogenase family protein [Gammaproteobacteria bacterium]
MKVTVFGCGYVGLVSGACLAEVGNDVLCVDTDARKVELLKQGKTPIHEPGLEDLLLGNTRAGRLNFTADMASAVRHGALQFIAVGTPPDEDGAADLQYVLAVARAIGEHMSDYQVVVNKSTVPVGTADKVRATLAEALKKRGVALDYSVVSNPEFLKEGAAIDDFMKPDRIVIGSSDARAIEMMRALYAPFNRSHERVLVMDARSAELTKYDANAMLATKISFMNELANIAERVGADIEQVRIGIGSDPRIGYHFIYPGCGYGGSCFPKDVQALARAAEQNHYRPELLHAVQSVNHKQKEVLFDKIHAHFNGKLKGKTIALWGLAFKPNTDDMREAPSRVLMEKLWAHGARVQAHDPVAMSEARRLYGERSDLALCEEPYEALRNADALALVTEWKVFRSPDFSQIKKLLKQPAVFDGRNLYDPDMLKREGILHYGIGRGNHNI